MTPARWLWVGTALYAGLYFAAGVDRYVTYHSGADLALFTQSIATVFHGFANTTEGGSHFTFHFSPIYYLCAPLLLVTHSPLALVAIQAVACALTAPALYFIARKRVSEAFAVGSAAIALLYAPLAGVAFTDFHENGFAPAAAAWLLWALDARRFAWAAVFVALNLSIKEDQAPIVAFLGLLALVYFARRRERAGTIFAAATIASAALVFGLYFAVVRPLAGATDAWGPLHFYAWSHAAQDGPSGAMSVVARAGYVAEAFVPLLGLAFWSPAVLLALPGFVENLASKESITFTMGQHYAGVWVGYVLVAFVLGAAAIHRTHPRRARSLLLACAALCGLNVVFASPTHWAHYLRPYNAHDAELDRIVAALPPGVEIGTHDEIFTHLGFDPHASLGMTRTPKCVLVDRTYTSVFWRRRDKPALEAGLRSGRYVLARSFGDVDVYRRSDAPAEACVR